MSAEPAPEDLPNHTFVPLDDLTRPKSGECLVDYWWVTHPDLGAVFVQGYPMCNSDEAITRPLAARMYPWAVAVKVPVAYLGRQP